MGSSCHDHFFWLLWSNGTLCALAFDCRMDALCSSPALSFLLCQHVLCINTFEGHLAYMCTLMSSQTEMHPLDCLGILDLRVA